MWTSLPGWFALRCDPGALAKLAFGVDARAPALRASRHLAFLPLTALELDLSDPEQRCLGDYELLEQIGAGGMGVVYRARQLSLDREVAIKLLSAGPWASPDFVARFQREAQSAAQLQHPNIVSIFEVGSFDEFNYFSMSLVRGSSLAQILDANGPFAPSEAARLVRTIAEALDYAHRLGVLHLDLKPGNVLIDANGEPQVADFGLARRLSEPFGVDSDEVAGTPSYMAPEQIEPEHHCLSPATDVHGLGAILYELLSGDPPYKAGLPHETLHLVLSGELRNLKHCGRAIPADLLTICEKCLAHEPEARYSDARALADDLGRFLEGREVSVRPLNAWQRLGRWMRREPRLAAVTAIAVTVLLTGILATSVQWRRADANAHAARQTAWAQRAQTAQQLIQHQEGYQALPLMLANLREAVTVGDADAIARERLRIGVALATWPRLIEVLGHGARIGGLALSPDASTLAAIDTNAVLRLHAVASGRELLRRRLDVPSIPAGLSYTPDGRYLLLETLHMGKAIQQSRLLRSSTPHAMLRLDARSGAVVPLPASDGRDALYSTDGFHALLLDRDRLDAQVWDVGADRAAGPRVTIGAAAAAHWMIAPDGAWLLRWNPADPTANVAVLDPRFRVRHTLAAPDLRTDAVVALAISPDGRWIAAGRNNGEVVLIDPATGATQLAQPGPSQVVLSLRFSEDSHWLLAGGGDTSVWTWPIPHGLKAGFRLGLRELPFSVGGHAASGVLQVTAEERILLWRLPELDRVHFVEDPLQLPALPLSGRLNAEVPIHAASGLIITSSQDGQVRLWRLPRPAARRTAGAPMQAQPLWFDDRHLVAVDDAVAWLEDAERQQPVSKRFVHPHSLGFAALTADGENLVTSSGRALYIHDWRTGHLRHPPIELPATPMELSLGPDGRGLASTHAETHDGRFHTVYTFIDVRSGRIRGAPIALPGSWDAATYSGNGRRVLLPGARQAQLRDATTGALLATYQVPGPHPALHSAALDHEGRRALLGYNQIAPGPIESDAELVLWDAQRNRVLRRDKLPFRATSLVFSPRGDAWSIYLAWWPAFELVSTGMRHHRLTSPADAGRWTRAGAYSPDGRLFARGVMDGVQLFDTATGEALGPPMRAPRTGVDGLVQLAFAPDGRSLLARTSLGRHMVWRIAPDLRPLDEIAADVALLAPSGLKAQAAVISSAERARLRRQDPGQSQQEVGPLAGRGCAAHPHPGSPPRDPSTPPYLLDLGRQYTSSLREVAHRGYIRYEQRTEWCFIPYGVLRFAGDDFDVRGVIDLHAQARVPQRQSATIDDIAATMRHPRAVLVLASLVTPPAVPGMQLELASLVLHYADDSQARVTIRRRDLGRFTTFGPVQAHPNAVWRGEARMSKLGLAPQHAWLHRVRLDNPHPERTLVRLDLEASGPAAGMHMAVFAVTLDQRPVAVH